MITDRVLLVLAKPVEGRVDDFNDWYSNIHIRDALRFRGSLAAQRFSALPGSAEHREHVHLAIYETFNAPLFTYDHRDLAPTSHMRITSAFDREDLSDYYYRPLSYRCDASGEQDDGAVVLEQYQSKHSDEATLREWLESEWVPSLNETVNIRSSLIVAVDHHHQMLPGTPAYDVAVIHRVEDIEMASANWPSENAQDTPHKPKTSFWQPITQRLTCDDIRNPTSAAVAAEEMARERLGTNFLPPNPIHSAAK